MAERPDLSGHVVLVTGGRRGLGATITQAFLEASDQATFITGSNLVVHGGGDYPPLMI